MSFSHPPTHQPDISDHAVLRFLERVKGIDVPAARGELEHLLQDDGVRRLLNFADGEEFRLRLHRDNLVVCGRRGRITTCYPTGKGSDASYDRRCRQS